MAAFILALGLPSGMAARQRGQNQPLYSQAMYQSARGRLARGDVKGAAAEFCRMLRPPADGELWTLSVILLCHPENLVEQADAIRAVRPVFIQAVDYKGLQCYRICAGLARDRTSMVRLGRSIRFPGGNKPFPVRVLASCSPQKEQENPPNTGGHHPRYLGPPVRQPAGESGGAASRGGARKAGEPPAKIAGQSSHKEAERLFRAGLDAYRAGRLKDAETLYLRSLALEPGRAEVLNNLGVLYLKDGDYMRARPLFEKALVHKPAYASAHLNLAGALWGLGDKDAAVQEAREAVVLDQTDINGYLTLASFYLSLGDKAAARDAARRALLLDPKNEQAEVFLSASEKKNGQ